MKAFLWAAGAILVLAAGCQTPRPLYYWGNYEKVMYLGYAKPEKATLEFQREKLEEDIQQAEGRGLQTPPGLHAQLGYVYFQLGQVDQAVAEFAREKMAFPESTEFMNRMIAKARGGDAS